MSSSVNPRTALAKLVDATKDGTLDALCEEFGVRLLCAFGSATRTGFEPKDLDIGVSFRRQSNLPHASLELRLSLWNALVNLSGCERIDLAVLDVDNPVLRAEALTGVPLFESVASEFAEAQIAAVGETRDLSQFRRRSLELMAQ